MAIVPPSSLPSLSEGMCYSTSYGITSNSVKLPIEGRRWHDLASRRCKSPFFGLSHFLWLSTGHDLCLPKVPVAADYSDFTPDSFSDRNRQRYRSDYIHPDKLSPAEIARATVEANKNAVLVFPGMVHLEPHDQISWAEFQYNIDPFGDIYFKISEDKNPLADRGAKNPVNAFIGMDIPIYDNSGRAASEYDIFTNGKSDESTFDVDDIPRLNLVSEMDESNIPVIWGSSNTANSIHPLYFSKCLTKAVNNMEYVKRMDHPSNGVSIIGYLTPVYDETRSYLRVYHLIGDLTSSGWKDLDSNSISNERDTNLRVYRLAILKIELRSIYGYQAEISVREFRDTEPDVVANSSSAIVEGFNQFIGDSVKALCKKRGLDAEEAYLIGVDSLGMDVRVLSGTEVKTRRFPFKFQADTINAARKYIWQLLFPRFWRNMKTWKCRSSNKS